MVTEVALVKHSDDVVLVMRIFLHDISKVLGFLVSKFVVHLCISSDLDSIYCLIGIFVVPALDDLSKRSLSEHLEDFIAVSNVLSNLYFVVSLVVVEDRITLELTITCIFSISFHFFKILSPLVVESSADLKVLARSARNGACIVDCVELAFTCSQLINFLLQHAILILFQKLPRRNRIGGLIKVIGPG